MGSSVICRLRIGAVSLLEICVRINSLLGLQESALDHSVDEDGGLSPQERGYMYRLDEMREKWSDKVCCPAVVAWALQHASRVQAPQSSAVPAWALPRAHSIPGCTVEASWLAAQAAHRSPGASEQPAAHLHVRSVRPELLRVGPRVQPPEQSPLAGPASDSSSSSSSMSASLA